MVSFLCLLLTDSFLDAAINAAVKAEAMAIECAGKSEVPYEECDGKKGFLFQRSDDGDIETTTPNAATNCGFNFELQAVRVL